MTLAQSCSRVCYGSFQIHNHGAAQTLFAYNRWGGAGGNGDLGIGNQGAGEPDWTFAQNANTYTTKNLQILVRTGRVTAIGNILNDDFTPMEFVVDVLGETDDITHFEYAKKNSRARSSAVVGIELKTNLDFGPLIERMKEKGFFGEYLNDSPQLFQYLV